MSHAPFVAHHWTVTNEHDVKMKSGSSPALRHGCVNVVRRSIDSHADLKRMGKEREEL